MRHECNFIWLMKCLSPHCSKYWAFSSNSTRHLDCYSKCLSMQVVVLFWMAMVFSKELMCSESPVMSFSSPPAPPCNNWLVHPIWWDPGWCDWGVPDLGLQHSDPTEDSPHGIQKTLNLWFHGCSTRPSQSLNMVILWNPISCFDKLRACKWGTWYFHWVLMPMCFQALEHLVL